MARRCILTVDVGTSSTKTALWDEAGGVLAEASASYKLERPSPVAAEIDPDLWWQAACDTTRQVVGQAGIQPEEVAGVGVDAVGWTLIPVAADGTPWLRP